MAKPLALGHTFLPFKDINVRDETFHDPVEVETEIADPNAVRTQTNLNVLMRLSRHLLSIMLAEGSILVLA